MTVLNHYPFEIQSPQKAELGCLARVCIVQDAQRLGRKKWLHQGGALVELTLHLKPLVIQEYSRPASRNMPTTVIIRQQSTRLITIANPYSNSVPSIRTPMFGLT